MYILSGEDEQLHARAATHYAPMENGMALSEKVRALDDRQILVEAEVERRVLRWRRGLLRLRIFLCLWRYREAQRWHVAARMDLARCCIELGWRR